MLRLYLLGRAQATITTTTEPLHIESRKAFALLVYLAMQEGELQRDQLATLLWPEQAQAKALSSLRQALYSLRRTIPEEVIQGSRQALRAVKEKLWIDASEFTALTSTVHPVEEPSNDYPARLEEAVALYQGDFLQGFTLPDCPSFDDWQFFQTEAYRQRFRGVLGMLMAWYVNQHYYERAIEFCRKMASLDPHDQEVHRQLMRLYAFAGQEAAALRQYEVARKLLADELGVEPDEETAELSQAIKQKSITAPPIPAPLSHDPNHATQQITWPAQDATATFNASSQRRSNLPLQPTSFVGRQRDLEELGELLANPTARLISIVAPGGMGKTRLALAAAEKQSGQESFKDGVFFVPLASVQSPDFLAQAVADAVGIKLLGSEPSEQQVIRLLSQQNLLLLLDNFEHLRSGSVFLSDLLAGAAGIKVLVTSREPTNVQEEWLYQLWGMAIPAGTVLTTEDLRTFSAIELFEQRAQKVNPHFDLSSHVKDVIRICQHLEGMPLAIELAASWVTTIPCKDIANEIEKGLGFLETKAYSVADRHRSLKTIFDYSWNRLTEAEQATLQKLSVFKGGFTRQAAEQIAGASLAILASLSAMLLIRLKESGRYDIHELLRQFAEEKLKTRPDVDEATRRAHAQYYADMLERLEPDLKGPKQLDALDDIAADSDNVLASWAWSISRSDFVAIGKLAMSFYFYCEMRGLAQMGSGVLQRAIDSMKTLNPKDDRTTIAFARLLLGHAVLRLRTGKHSPQQVEHSVKLLKPRTALDTSTYIHALHWLATRLPYEGKHEEAESFLKESEELARNTNDAFSMGWLLQTRGHNMYIAGRFRDAEPSFEQSLAAFEACGEKRLQAFCFNNWSRTAIGMGNYSRAARLNSKGLTIREQANDPLGVATSSLIRARLKTTLGEYQPAKELLRQAASLMQQTSNYQYWIMLEQEQGQLELALGNLERAQQHFQKAQRVNAGPANPYYEPKSLNGLAFLHYLRNDHAEARALLVQSLTTSDGLGHLQSKATALRHLGFVELSEKKFGLAKDYFRQALRLCRETGAAPLALDILVGWTELEAVEKKLILLALVQRDSRATFQTRKAARQKWRELLNGAPQDIQAITAHDEGLDLWQVVNEMTDIPPLPQQS